MIDVLSFLRGPDLDQCWRSDPHVFCRSMYRGKEIYYRVTDDDWYLWFIAQYPKALPKESLNEVALLLRLVERHDALFRFELHDERRRLRAVFQLPIADEPRLEDDIPAAELSLRQEWGTLLPFLDRVVDGRDGAEVVAADALQAFRELDEKNGRALKPLAATTASS